MAARTVVALCALLTALAPAIAEVPSVEISKELFITDLGVVNHAEATSPTGAFHIKTLFDAMAPSGKDAKDVMLSFLGSFRDDAPDRPPRLIDGVVLDGWKRWQTDGTQLPPGSAVPSDEDWTVNWEKAPFRLLAIVNRMDLRHNPNIGNAGEGRFVFGVLNPDDASPLSFTIIFEFVQPASSAAEIEVIAEAWHELGGIAAFDQTFVDKLKTVTAKFAGPNAAPARPNGSSLGQIRTNEIALNDFTVPSSGWELREWRLKTNGGLLEPDTVKETPPASLDNSAFLAFLLDRFGSDLSSELPDQLLGFRAITGFSPSFQWQANGVSSNDPRLRKFSVHTCSGCHGGDGNTADGTPFLHVTNRSEHAESTLSRFLTGSSNTPVIDPATGNEETDFSDLEFRKVDFQSLLCDQSVQEFAAQMMRQLRVRRSRVH